MKLDFGSARMETCECDFRGRLWSIEAAFSNRQDGRPGPGTLLRGRSEYHLPPAGERRGWRVSASAVPSAGTLPSAALRRLVVLSNNQTSSESCHLYDLPSFKFVSNFAPFGV